MAIEPKVLHVENGKWLHSESLRPFISTNSPETPGTTLQILYRPGVEEASPPPQLRQASTGKSKKKSLKVQTVFVFVAQAS